MATPELVSSGLSLSIARMTEHDLLEVVEIEELSGISAWGWDAYHKELQSPQDVIMLIAKTATTESAQYQRSLIAGFIVSRLVAGELHINNVAVRPEFHRRGIAVSTHTQLHSTRRRRRLGTLCHADDATVHRRVGASHRI